MLATRIIAVLLAFSAVLHCDADKTCSSATTGTCADSNSDRADIRADAMVQSMVKVHSNVRAQQLTELPFVTSPNLLTVYEKKLNTVCGRYCGEGDNYPNIDNGKRYTLNVLGEEVKKCGAICAANATCGGWNMGKDSGYENCYYRTDVCEDVYNDTFVATGEICYIQKVVEACQSTEKGYTFSNDSFPICADENGWYRIPLVEAPNPFGENAGMFDEIMAPNPLGVNDEIMAQEFSGSTETAAEKFQRCKDACEASTTCNSVRVYEINWNCYPETTCVDGQMALIQDGTRGWQETFKGYTYYKPGSPCKR